MGTDSEAKGDALNGAAMPGLPIWKRWWGSRWGSADAWLGRSAGLGAMGMDSEVNGDAADKVAMPG